MKGYYERKSNSKRALYSVEYQCDHPLYSTCTLFTKGKFGLAVIQKRFNQNLKATWWDAIDPWLANDIFEMPTFDQVFSKRCGVCEEGLYPVIEVRKLMYELGMKPMRREYWEHI